MAFSSPTPRTARQGSDHTIRRMSSELDAMDHEAQSYLEHEREQFKKVGKVRTPS